MQKSKSFLLNLSKAIFPFCASETSKLFDFKKACNKWPRLTSSSANNIEIIQPGCDENILGTATAVPSGGTGDFNFLMYVLYHNLIYNLILYSFFIFIL